MEPQKSIILPVSLTLVISAIIFGSLGYYVASDKNATVTQTYTTQTTATTQPAAKATSTSAATSNTSTTTNTDETANWKTYTNDKHGFSFKYPPEWKLYNDIPLSPDVFGAGPSEEGGEALFQVIVSSETSAESYITDLKKYYETTSNIKLVSDESVTKFDSNARKLTYTVGLDYTNSDYVISKNNIVYEITGESTDKQRSDVTDLTNKIVNTFKFTK